ncbi:hypothetical protein ABIE26_004813 [Pedobacter africanus]|uniref:Uncharacterized protein n=1 Tax=Pedobacter africanus TaxID=151894 RepID=A0ACC6L366_9SPHI|nr:hypothetical protein [Pedobacter africanus]MDR6785718.1 hypothetical protein [Pedobacter africanus]
MKVIYKITLVILFSIGVVVTLYLLQEKPKQNGFKRGKTYTPALVSELELKYNSWYIYKLSHNRIYLGNSKAWLLSFSCNYDLTDSVYERLLYANESRQDLDLLKKQVIHKISPGGEIFSTDGYLNYNETSGQLVFTYYYRNTFVWLDSSLNVLRSGKLIDTNSMAKIKLGSYKSAEGKQIRTTAAPTVIINKRGYITGNDFYNHSGLAADNERLAVFNRHEVLDVYRLDDGSYSHSIYLPRYRGKKLSDFAVRGNLIIALYGAYLVTYKLQGKEVLTK